MGLHASDTTARQAPAGVPSGWVSGYVLRERSFSGDLASVVRDAIRRLASRIGANRIRAGVMSDAWLRTHETEHHKHGAEF